ncbi:hypothetical protein RJ639_025016 [Escallonia herrerae]|uniref:Uncharacterized protein n=1 Tax=Escallonia herrerae TaxID=1293975 RepID=A0AA88UVD7_9ASTE|nr:hypothetical protein RJ639_025016 [Escallonia herrerae]
MVHIRIKFWYFGRLVLNFWISVRI